MTVTWLSATDMGNKKINNTKNAGKSLAISIATGTMRCNVEHIAQ